MAACRARRWPNSISRHSVALADRPRRSDLGEITRCAPCVSPWNPVIREPGHPAREAHNNNWRAARDSFNCWVTISPWNYLSKYRSSGPVKSFLSFDSANSGLRVSCRYDRLFPSTTPVELFMGSLIISRLYGSINAAPVMPEGSQVNEVIRVCTTVVVFLHVTFIHIIHSLWCLSKKEKGLFYNTGVGKSHRDFLFMQTFTYVMSNMAQYGISSWTICILSSRFRDTIPTETICT